MQLDATIGPFGFSSPALTALICDAQKGSKTEENTNPGCLAIRMDYTLPFPSRRKAPCSALSRARADYLSAPPAPQPSRDEVIRAFRHECARPSLCGFPSYLSASQQDLPPLPAEAPIGEPLPLDWEAGRRYLTHAGVRVRSKAEKIIADFLTDNGLQYFYEPIVRVNGCQFRPDFYLPGLGVFYEHFGYDTEAHLRAAEAKLARYHAADVPFIYTTFNDEPDIEDVIVDKLAEDQAQGRRDDSAGLQVGTARAVQSKFITAAARILINPRLLRVHSAADPWDRKGGPS
jgi:hypothetical protein